MLYLLFSLGVILMLLNAKKAVEIVNTGNQDGDYIYEENYGEENFKGRSLMDEGSVFSEDWEEMQLLKEEVLAVLDELKEEKRKLYYLKIKDNTAEKEERQKILQEEPIIQQSNKPVKYKRKETEELYRQVYILREKGKNNDEIARKLNIGKGEVEFILSIKR